MTNSMLSLYNPFGNNPQPHFIDYFDGTQEKSFWNRDAISGNCPVFSMVDCGSEGFRVQTDNVSTERAELDFNNRRPFAEDGSVFIAQMRRVSGADTQSAVGLMNTSLNQNHHIRIHDSTANTFKRMVTRDTSGSSFDSTISADTNWFTARGELFSSFAKMYINGGFENVSTVTLPTVKLQGGVFTSNLSSSIAAETRFKYFEAFNH